MKKVLITICLAALCVVSCKQSNYVEFQGYAQGGTYSVKADIAGVKVPQEEIAARIAAILEEIDTTFSGYNRRSMLSRMNAGEYVKPTPLFEKLRKISEEYIELSDGAFNIYGGPLFDVWGFGFKNNIYPSEEQIQEALQKCKEHKVMNFNAIAQGFCCDAVAEYLYSIGVKNMLVNLGEIYCDGVNPNGEPWSIAIDTPIDGNNTPGAHTSGIWYSKGGKYGVVTSGNYRKFYIIDGKKYAHTIDTRKGYPVEHNLLSATVVAPNASMADACATWLMVVGAEEAKKIVLANDDMEACLITTDGIWKSPGF